MKKTATLLCALAALTVCSTKQNDAETQASTKSYSGLLNVRISPETHSKIATLSKQAGISINAFIKEAIDSKVATILL